MNFISWLFFTEDNMISVIIPAAGTGSRMQLGFNKVYLNLKGIPLFLFTIKKFLSIEGISEILLVVDENHKLKIENLVKKYDFASKIKIVKGGRERQDSVYNGLKEVSSNSEIILIHDAARPLVTKDIIEKVIENTKKYNAAICGVYAKDTISIINDDGFILNTPKRDNLFLVQTPQGFKKNIIVEAVNKAYEDNFYGTDEGSLVQRLGYKIKVVEGSYENIKITTPSDLVFMENILNHDISENKNIIYEDLK